MRTYKVIAEENKEMILKMISEGSSKKQIYSILKCSSTTFDKVLKHLDSEYNYYGERSADKRFKYCRVCGELKRTEKSFYLRKSGNSTYRLSVCKSCQRRKSMIEYKKNINTLSDYKSSLGCAKCGNKKHYVLDFHHIDPKQKLFNISSKFSSDIESEIIKEEIAKCVVLCSNCHREFHYLEREEDMTIEKYLKE